MTRREFVAGAAGVAGALGLGQVGVAAAWAALPNDGGYAMVAEVDRARIMKRGGAVSERGAGDGDGGAQRAQRRVAPHDYFSEGDYWWPDPKNPGGPYIRRDGFSNPANFNDASRGADPAERDGAGAGRGLAADEGQALRGAV